MYKKNVCITPFHLDIDCVMIHTKIQKIQKTKICAKNNEKKHIYVQKND